MKTVAIFDDDHSICDTIQKLVLKKGMVCVTAQSIPEAAYEMGQSQPDIVIADFEFQHGLNISLLADNLKDMAEQVIIVTGGDPKEILEEYPELKFAKFVKKGTSLKKLVAELEAS